MQYHRARRARAPPPETMSAPFSVPLATRQQKKVRTPAPGPERTPQAEAYGTSSIP